MNAWNKTPRKRANITGWADASSPSIKLYFLEKMYSSNVVLRPLSLTTLLKKVLYAA